jgi:hypothetical protein
VGSDNGVAAPAKKPVRKKNKKEVGPDGKPIIGE